MHLYHTIEEVKLALLNDLPGSKAHKKMMSEHRKSAIEARNQKTPPKESSVMILLYPKNNELHNILMLRQEYPGTHSGQISFPGGKKELSDQSLEETALRESHEEIGILPSSIEIVGKLTEIYIPPSNFVVTPFVGFTKETPIFIPEPKEVADLIEYPILDILNPQNTFRKEIFLESYNVSIHTNCFNIQGHTVWGATAMILQEFSDILSSLSQTLK